MTFKNYERVQFTVDNVTYLATIRKSDLYFSTKHERVAVDGRAGFYKVERAILRKIH